MKRTEDWLLELLECPGCRGVGRSTSLTRGGAELCCESGHRYPIVDGVFQFIDSEGYTGNFGYQWTKFSRTQLDSRSGLSLSKDRFYAQSGWDPDELRGRTVIDVGCGAGRFAEIAVGTGAKVVAVDASDAVFACWKNLGERENVRVIQADIFDLPFRPGSFDFVYCFGVLQHTPDVRGAFFALPRQLAPGGRIAVDVYRKHWSNWVHPKYWFRPISTRLSRDLLFKIVARWVPLLLPVSDFLGRLPGGRYLRRLVPVANYRGTLPLNDQSLLEWAILDTFDWFGAKYDQPQTGETLVSWARECGLVGIELVHPAHLTVRGRKP